MSKLNDGTLKRVKKYKTEKVDHSIGTEEVFEKYGGICQKCGISTIRSHPPQHNTASLEHIVPLSRGGSHTWDNITLLCHRCNTNKNDALGIAEAPKKKPYKGINIISKLVLNFRFLRYRVKIYREAS